MMASVEFSLDNGMLVVGDASAFDEASDLPLESLPAVGERLLVVECRQQIAPVRIELWRHSAPLGNVAVPNAGLTLVDGLLGFGECFGQPRFQWPVSSPGALVEIGVSLDDASEASLVTVVVDPNGDVLPSFVGRRRDVVDQLHGLEKLDSVLAGRSFPVERLSAAFRTIREQTGSSSAARVRYSVETVAEWMRGLRRGTSKADVSWVHPLVGELVASQTPDAQAAALLIERLADALDTSTAELLDSRW